MRQIINANMSLKTWVSSYNIIWKNVVLLVVLHLLLIYSLFFFHVSKFQTLLFCYFYMMIGVLGVGAGAHRLWCHRAYKAKLPLRIFLAFCNSTAIQTSVWEFSRDHRVHHKYSETDADPHNINRGIFFAHIGWLMCKKHPEVINKGKTIDLSDLHADPVVMFQKRYYIPLIAAFGLILPTLVPILCWNEKFLNAFLICFAFRYVYSLHGMWLINSAAHMWGNRPYDPTISPTDNLFVTTICYGEAFHNYHHAFPWDYSTSEWGVYFNFTTGFINVMSYIGQAYDLKTASKEVIRERWEKTNLKMCQQKSE